jgi:hypothetical protein
LDGLAGNIAELTAGGRWQFCAQPAGEGSGAGGSWAASLAEVCRALQPPPRRLEWFATWQAVHVGDFKPPWTPMAPPPSATAARPVRPAVNGLVDLVPLFGIPRNGRTAWLTTSVELDRDTPVTIYTGGDYWMAWHIDGQPVFDTLAAGNDGPVLDRANLFTVPLARGRHEIAVQLISGNGGWALAAEAFAGRPPCFENVAVRARSTFALNGSPAPASLTCVADEPERIRLNGQPLPVIADGRIATVIDGVRPAMLRAGENELSLAWDEAETAAGLAVEHLRLFAGAGKARKLSARAALRALQPQDLALIWGPVLGETTSNSITLTCRLNMPAAVEVRVGETVVRSDEGLVHRLRVGGLSAGARLGYDLLGRLGSGEQVVLARGTAQTFPQDGTPLRLAICGDAGPLPPVWAQNARAIATHQPDLCVFLGDMVSFGRQQDEWGDEFLHPGAALFASTPVYPILGNHDEASPLFDEIFTTPGGRNWSQRIGPLLLVGLNGTDDWSAGAPAAAWLDGVLAGAADARFILAFNHYPAWSSGPHLRTGADGQPVEKYCRVSRNLILPILQRHRVTALFSGHDHLYERSVLPSGMMLFISGGAGAYLYEKGARGEQNPYSRAYASTHHHCLIDLEAARCVLRAIALDGRLIDEVSLPPRP